MRTKRFVDLYMNMRDCLQSLFYFPAAVLLVFFLACCGDDAGKLKASADYLAEINNWHAERVKRLTSRTGWLSLSGLFWLREGENTFGSDPENRIKFPAGRAPRHIGSFLLANGQVLVRINDGVDIFYQDSLVKEIEMKPDVSGNPTILHLDSLSWFIIKRGIQTGVRLRDSENERLTDFKGIDRFPVDSTWRVSARLEPYTPPKILGVPTILGSVDSSASPGALVFTIAGQSYRLDPLGDPGDKKLFLIFADKTNGYETYGAGRFLSVDAPGEDGLTFIDFNKAYNPPCAFTPYATCPLPPPQNVLPVAVTAGEKKYGEH